MMNGTEAGRFSTGTPNTEETHLIPVPAQAASEGQITMMIKAASGKATPTVYEARLVTE